MQKEPKITLSCWILKQENRHNNSDYTSLSIIACMDLKPRAANDVNYHFKDVSFLHLTMQISEQQIEKIITKTRTDLKLKQIRK